MRLKRFLSIVIAVVISALSCFPAFAAIEDTGFTDVNADQWYAEAVEYCVEHELMSGMSDTSFGPDMDMNRAMMAAVLYRQSGSPAVTDKTEFSDVEENQWYSNSIAWAVQNGVFSGYSGNVFGTNDSITREQAVSVLWRYASSPQATGEINFSDASDISDWALNAVLWAQENNIMNIRTGNTFAPKANATRAELAYALMNCFSLEPNADNTENKEPEDSMGSQENSSTDNQNTNTTLIAYFSRTGNTEQVAEFIQEYTEGDIVRIVTSSPYPESYNDVLDVAQREQNENARPEISTVVENIEEYDTIFIGYPIWYGDAPMAVYSFLEKYDLSNKTIIPFATSGSSGIGTSERNIRTNCSDSTVLEGLLVSGSSVNSAKVTVENWLKGLNIQMVDEEVETAA